MGLGGTVAVLSILLGLVAAQTPASTTDLISYYPVGTVALPSVTESPSAYVGPEPNQTQSPQPPAEPAKRTITALRNIVELRCSSFNEFRAMEYFTLVASIVSRWIASSTSNASVDLRNALMVAFNSSSTSLFGDAYSADSLFARLVPSRTLFQGSSPIPLSHRQLPPMIAVEYGSMMIVSLMLIPLNATSKGLPVAPDSGSVRYAYPVGLSATSPTAETNVLCEIFSVAFRESVLSGSRPPLSSVSSAEDFIQSAIVDVRCPQFLPRVPAVPNVGVNWLWVAFIVLGGVCISMTVYTMFLRTHSDADVDINAATTNATSGGVDAKQSEAEDPGSRVDEKTESGFAIDTERLQLVERRKKRRLNELISKALTGDSTIYGASEEEREMVALVLKNPRFDGGRLAHDGEASPVEVVLTHDRLFRLPPVDFTASTGVVGRKGGGRVTTVTFPAAVHRTGVAMVDGSGSLSASEIVDTGSLTSNMERLQQEDSLDHSEKAVGSASYEGPTTLEAEKPAEGRDETEDETTRLNRMITEATLRNLQRREGQLAAPSSTIKDRLKKILESDDYDNV